MLTLSDEELVVRCKRELPGDTRSYEALVSRHISRVYGLIYRMVNNQEEAEDITQEVFLKVYHHLHKFEQQASFSSWLYRVATNSALDALDKLKRRPKTSVPKNIQGAAHEEEVSVLNAPSSSAANPEDTAIQTELRECVHRVLKKLEREQARLLLLRDFNDLSYDEIADLLQVSLSAVKMRIHRARLAFQEIFSRLCGSSSLPFSVATNSGSKGKSRFRKV